ncbi:MAG: calcium-binding protein [Nitrososphaeraceae archaeon]
MTGKYFLSFLGVLIIVIFFLPLVGAQNNSNFTIKNEVQKPSVGKPKVDVTIDGTSGNDKLRGGDGNDEISGKKGDDIISGNDGDDEIEGGAGDDKLEGGAGDDKLEGGAGDDELDGSIGNDNLDGGSGDDRLIGGPGTDELEGGEGADTFICDEDDNVVDFSSVENDQKEGGCEVIDRALAEKEAFSDFFDETNEDEEIGEIPDDFNNRYPYDLLF